MSIFLAGIFAYVYQAGMSLGFDLKGSLAAIEQWVDQMESEEEQDEEIEAMGKEERHGKGAAKKFVRPGSSRGILMDKDAKEAKILSRDKIISMVRLSFLFNNIDAIFRDRLTHTYLETLL